MFSGGEKKSFFAFFVIGNSTIATLAPLEIFVFLYHIIPLLQDF